MDEATKERTGIWSEFLKFALRGNVIELAVAFVVGGAFAKITASFVSDILMPLTNPLIPQGDWRNLVVGPGVRIGSFLGALLDFMIIASALFFVMGYTTQIQRKR
jgi:large conductance mechanosensitive channel